MNRDSKGILKDSGDINILPNVILVDFHSEPIGQL